VAIHSECSGFALKKNDYEYPILKGFDNEAINQKHGWNSGSIAGQHQRPGEITIGGKF